MPQGRRDLSVGLAGGGRGFKRHGRISRGDAVVSEFAPKNRKSAAPALQGGPAKAGSTAQGSSRGSLPGLMQGAGPTLGLGVQRQVAVGTPGDRFEREADAVADRVGAGQSVEPSAISPVTPDALAQTAAAPEMAIPEKKPEAVPVQRKGSGPGSEERRHDVKPVQKAEAKAEEKKPDMKPVQKAEAKPAERKPDMKPVQKAEAKPAEKKPDVMPVQKAEAKPAEKKPDVMPVQKAEAKPAEQKPDVMPVQKAEAKPQEKKPVQTDAAGNAAPSSSMGAAASAAIASKGDGKPIEPTTRGALESRLGADLGHVRVHDDATAAAAAHALNARAFTHGSDIWLGSGASQSDTRLMAHEATHVVQQSGGVHRMVQRANGGGGGAATGPAAAGAAVPDKPLTSPAGEVIDVKNRKMLL